MNLSYFSRNDYYQALQQFFSSLNLPLNPITEAPGDPAEILSSTYNPNNPAHKLIDQVYVVGMVSEEAFTQQQTAKYSAVARDIKTRDYDGLLLFGVTLKNGDRLPTRSQLAEITRAFNREFHYTPVVVIFKYGDFISFANCERLAYKQAWREGEKAGKVSLLKDISVANPHSGHLRILQSLEISRSGNKAITTFAGLYKYWQEVLNVNILNKVFYKELFNWYLYAVKNVTFPNPDKLANEVNNSINVIRLLTRLIFCWFIREKGLIPGSLFDEKELQKILAGANGVRPDVAEAKAGASHAPLRSNDSTYYKAILQNLFFATLNTEMNRDNPGGRRFITEEKINGVNPDYNNFTVYRHKKLFSDPEAALRLFEDIPFLNGGLFECLDSVETVDGKNREIRYDGFSSTPAKQPVVPDSLFFGKIENVDFSNEYGGTAGNHETVTGLIDILNSYKFTIAENTPLEEEVALDPELLGRVFENLLASYNPETRTTARNQTGSFYTPREIVHYMVDESLKAYLSGKVDKFVGAKQASSASPAFSGDSSKGEAGETLASPLHDKLSSLFTHTDIGNPFADNEELTDRLIKAISNARILDPACGSGAFPMGILHQMANILGKLDPNNRKWKQAQLDIVEEDRKKAEELRDEVVREGALNSVEERKRYIEDSFDSSHHELDYLRKLFLIENCIYGVDIQNIAVQIAKLRFFISLIVEQRDNPTDKNRGILPMPNLETKFVAADSLIKLERPEQYDFGTHAVEKAEFELRQVRERIFYARKYKDKKELRKQEKIKREALEKALLGSNWGKATAHQVAEWNPFDVSSSAPFFDPEMMFGIKNPPPLQADGRGGDGVGGFNIVIGNPPYIQIQSFSGQPVQKAWEAQNYEAYTKTGDIYCLFYERGFNLLAEKGVLAYITSNKWMRANYGKAMRKFFLNNGFLSQIIDFGDSQIFENATTYTNILLWHKSVALQQQSQSQSCPNDSIGHPVSKAGFPITTSGMTPFLKVWDLSKTYAADTLLPAMLEKQGAGDPLFTEDSFVIASGGQAFVKKRVEEVGVPLKNWDISIYRGVLTGLNEAFIITGKKKDELIAQDPKSAEIIKPILRGRDIKRYKADFADLWLINSHNGYASVPRIDVTKDYPAIWEHLKSVNTATNGGLERRQDKGAHWSNLRNCAYLEAFVKKKIVWPETSIDNQLCFIEENIFLDKTTFFMVSGDKYLLSVLNSSVAGFYLDTIVSKMRGGYYSLSKIYVEQLPIPQIPTEEQLPYECLVDCIIFAHEKSLTTEAATFEWVVNVMVYGLYFEAEMKQAHCYINDLVAKVVKPFKADDTDQFKTEYVQKLNQFFLKDKEIYHGLVHSRNVKPVEIIHGAMKK